MNIFLFLKEVYKKFPGQLIGTVALILLTGALSACSLLAISPLVDFITKPDLKGIGPITQKAVLFLKALGLPVCLETWLAIFFLFVALTNIVQVTARYFIVGMKYKVLKRVTLDALGDFFNARWYFFTSQNQGTLINTFVRELEVVGNAFGAMTSFFAGIVQFIFYLVVPFFISWKVTCLSGVMAVVFALPFVFFGKISYRWGRRNTATGNSLSTAIQENLNLAKVILGFGNQKQSLGNIEKAYDAHQQVTVKSQTLMLAIPLLYRPFAVLVIGAALLSSRWFGVPFAEITVLIFALFQAANLVGDLSMQYNSLQNFFPSYEQIKVLRKKAVDFKQVSGPITFTDFKKEVFVSDLTFAYPGHAPVLRGINLSIPKGKMVALVGKSGSGKSTLVDLLMGFHEPTQGTITLDGIPLEEIDRTSYRQKIGYVPQDSVLFNMSIKDNLLWAYPDAREKDIQLACRTAYAEEFILAFPQGYDTIVGDRGVRLSGGQLQRVALARAFLRKPQLLILDEATSSLDSLSEGLIQQAIENVSKATTVVVIAHRLSTIKRADCIYVLNQGKIVEQGSYAQLIEKGEQFHSMARLQELDIITTV